MPTTDPQQCWLNWKAFRRCFYMADAQKLFIGLVGVGYRSTESVLFASAAFSPLLLLSPLGFSVFYQTIHSSDRDHCALSLALSAREPEINEKLRWNPTLENHTSGGHMRTVGI